MYHCVLKYLKISNVLLYNNNYVHVYVYQGLLSTLILISAWDVLISDPEKFKVVYARPVNWLMKVDLRNTQKKLRILYTCIRTQ